jgi:hypothetical protein
LSKGNTVVVIKFLVFVCIEILVIGGWPALLAPALSECFGRGRTEHLGLDHILGSRYLLRLPPYSMVGPLLLSSSLCLSFLLRSNISSFLS